MYLIIRLFLTKLSHKLEIFLDFLKTIQNFQRILDSDKNYLRPCKTYKIPTLQISFPAIYVHAEWDIELKI